MLMRTAKEAYHMERLMGEYFNIPNHEEECRNATEETIKRIKKIVDLNEQL